jgi:hypothetical protein
MDLPQPPSGGAGDFLASERRASPRYPYQRKILCQPCLDPGRPAVSCGSEAVPCSPRPRFGGAPQGDGMGVKGAEADDIWLMGISQDLSASGIGFILHRRFDPGTLLTIELERPKRDSRRSESPVATWGQLPARVLHATPQPDGYWRLGCALVQALSEEELRSWINGLGRKVAPHQ